jgi:hypothetical protein
MKALDDFRFQGDFLVPIDGTGYLSFSHHHCPQCLTQKHPAGKVSYLHPVLEAKLVSATGLAFSLASEFIENPPGRTQLRYSGTFKYPEREFDLFLLISLQVSSCFLGWVP